MSAALSLLDDDPFDDQNRALAPPAPNLAAVPDAGVRSGSADGRSPQAMDPDMLRERETFARALRPGGLSIGLLIISTLISSPALFQCLVRHSITVTTLVERWVLITLGCWVVSELARFYLDKRPATSAVQAKETEGLSAADQKAAGFDPLSAAPYEGGPTMRDPLGDLP